MLTVDLFLSLQLGFGLNLLTVGAAGRPVSPSFRRVEGSQPRQKTSYSAGCLQNRSHVTLPQGTQSSDVAHCAAQRIMHDGSTHIMHSYLPVNDNKQTSNLPGILQGSLSHIHTRDFFSNRPLAPGWLRGMWGLAGLATSLATSHCPRPSFGYGGRLADPWYRASTGAKNTHRFSLNLAICLL
jgi:hypothetical protein